MNLDDNHTATTKRGFRLTKKQKIIAALIVIPIAGLWAWYQPDIHGIPKPGRVPQIYMFARTEGRLFYPNGKLFQDFGGSQTIWDSSAFSGAVQTTSDSPEQVYQWYHDWLLEHGWEINPAGGIQDTISISTQYYRKGDRQYFYVSIDDPKQLSLTLGRAVPSGVTVFEARYTIF